MQVKPQRKKLKTNVNPYEILLVIDAMVGQDAVNVAKTFDEKLGIDGIEAHYSKHTKEDEQQYLELAKKYKLLVTGGSDLHRYPEKEEDVDLGQATVSDKELEALLNKLKFKIKE